MIHDETQCNYTRLVKLPLTQRDKRRRNFAILSILELLKHEMIMNDYHDYNCLYQAKTPVHQHHCLTLYHFIQQ
jgi:hypothetical protein